MHDGDQSRRTLCRRLPQIQRGIANIRFAVSEMKNVQTQRDYDHLTMVGHSMGGDISMYFAKMYPDQIKKLVTLDNLRVPFMTDGKFKILSFRSKDPVFKTDPGVLPEEEVREEGGITVVHTGFQHNDMRDSGPIKPRRRSRTCWANSSSTRARSNQSRPNATCTDRSGPGRALRASQELTSRRSKSRSLRTREGPALLSSIDRPLIPTHIRLAAILRALMSGEPTNPKSAGDVTSAQKAGSGKAGSLPETKPSASEDIAAFVAKARAMSPNTAGAKGRLVFALDATMSRQPTWEYGLCAAGGHVSRGGSAGQS